MLHPEKHPPLLLHTLIGKLVLFTAVFEGFYTVFGGVARAALATVNAICVDTIPAVITLCLFAASYLDALSRRHISRFMLALPLIIIFYFIYALGMHLGALQLAMGFYVWMLFLLGILLCVYRQEEAFFKFALIFWALSVAGVLLNAVIDFPWIGVQYDVAGATMNAARDWNAAGHVHRLPGFSRTSAEVAADIFMFGVYIIVARKYPAWLKIAIYVFSLATIYLTTSKTELALMGFFPLLLFTYRGLRRLWPQTYIALHFAAIITFIMVGAAILMPLTLGAHRQIHMTGPLYGFMTTDSFVERMTGMWPDAFDILNKNGNPLCGAGIGSIGAGQSMMQPTPDTINAADNLFVYMYVEGGLFFALPLFLGFLLNQKYVYRNDENYFEIIWSLSFCVIGISMMVASIEESMTAMMLGFLVARGYLGEDGRVLRV